MEIIPHGQYVGHQPGRFWVKPSIVIMGESNYSDAHLFPVAYKIKGVGKTSNKIDVSSLKKGLYFLEISSELFNKTPVPSVPEMLLFFDRSTRALATICQFLEVGLNRLCVRKLLC